MVKLLGNVLGKVRVAGFVSGALAGLALGVPIAYALLLGSPDRPTLDGSGSARRPGKSAVDALIVRSQEALAAKQPEQALSVLRDALRLAPLNVVVQNNMCVALIELEQYDQAIAACNSALMVQPDFKLAKNNLAWARSKLPSASATATSTLP